jgi:hypothetical protein
LFSQVVNVYGNRYAKSVLHVWSRWTDRVSLAAMELDVVNECS